MAAKKKAPKKPKKKKQMTLPTDDIYQRIWDADQKKGSGLRAVARGTNITATLEKHGYILVDEPAAGDQVGTEHVLMPEVHIPADKRKTYKLVERLFDNYTLLESQPEEVAPEEDDEIQSFIETILDTAPMQVAREYIEDRTEPMSDDVWWNVIQRAWFEQFRGGRDPGLTGFEHVVVGEQEARKVQGYHFWYKYHVDENFRFGDLRRDLIQYLGNKEPGETTPDVATISYSWEAFDYQKKKFVKLTKAVGGFWIGPSIEGLMALGTVRFHSEAKAPKEGIINGVHYQLELARSENDRNIRTFFPKFVQMVG
jgi:poly(U)-specific endoribonuclease